MANPLQLFSNKGGDLVPTDLDEILTPAQRTRSSSKWPLVEPATANHGLARSLRMTGKFGIPEPKRRRVGIVPERQQPWLTDRIKLAFIGPEMGCEEMHRSNHSQMLL